MKAKYLTNFIVLTLCLLSAIHVKVCAATNNMIGPDNPGYGRIRVAAAEQDLACLKKLGGLRVLALTSRNAEAMGVGNLQDKAELVLRRNGIKTYAGGEMVSPHTADVLIVVNIYTNHYGKITYDVDVSVSREFTIPETGYLLTATVVEHSDSGSISSTQSAAKIVRASLVTQLDWLSNMFLKANEATNGSGRIVPNPTGSGR